MGHHDSRIQDHVSSDHARYISAVFAEIVTDFHALVASKLLISPEEAVILCAVAADSTREMRASLYGMKNYGREIVTSLPLERPKTTVRSIYSRLGLSRETARRRLEGLAQKGLIRKVPGGYILPQQTGEDDFTSEFRAFFLRKLSVLNGNLGRIAN